jgi:uncharacterized protein DUF6484
LFKIEDALMNDCSGARVVASSAAGGEELARLLEAPVDAAVARRDRKRIVGVVSGTLVGFADAGATPLVTYHDQPGSAALPAQAVVNLHGADIGRRVVLMFEDGDPHRPIIMGCLKDAHAKVPSTAPAQVVVDSDGDRLIVSARERIVLRCGKASITLTKEGKLILQGAYVSSQSSGVLRIKGGSVHIN